MWFDKSTEEAKRRWAEMLWPCNLKFFEDCNMLWPTSGTGEPRVLSADEADTLLGYPRGFTRLPDGAWRDLQHTPGDVRCGLKRRNAAGISD